MFLHRAALRELDVDDAASKLPGELSGGMSKRVGIARAVITEPEILVYDEPTSGLDPVSSRVVDGLIERMRTGHGVTSVVITHDMVTANGISDRVILLAGGKAVAEGPPEELFRSHGRDIQAFAEASGVDLARRASRFWGGRGAFWGTLWGMLFGSAFFVIPVLGPIVVMGPLVGFLVGALEGAAVGGAAGALSAALTNLGIPKDSVVKYELDVKAGKFLVLARGSAEMIQHARSVLQGTGTVRLDAHTIQAAAAE